MIGPPPLAAVPQGASFAASFHRRPERDFEHRRLAERLQQQQGVIRCLWDRYTQDVGHEPTLVDVGGPGGPGIVGAAQIRAGPSVRGALLLGQSFEEAVDDFKFQWTHHFTEVPPQRPGTKARTMAVPTTVSRKVGDVVISGFWEKGVTLIGLDKLHHKVAGLPHGSLRRIDLSDNGLRGNAMPHVMDLLRRGCVQLDLSQNALDSLPVQHLCAALPQTAPGLESLDLRFNPCASDPAFVHCLAERLPEMKLLEKLSVQVRQRERRADRSISPGGGPRRTPGGGAAAGRRRGLSQERLGTGRALGGYSQALPARGNHGHPEAWRGGGRGFGPPPPHGRATSPRGRGRALSTGALGHSSGALGHSSMVPGHAPPPGGGAAELAHGHDAAVALFRALPQCARLRHLDLRSSRLSRPALQRLSHLVRGDTLATLSLADCFLGAAVEPVLDAVSSCRRLVRLNLRLNDISGHTGIDVCRALDSSASLTEVDLSSNGLGDDFGSAFGKVLEANDVLWRVDLSRNRRLGEETGAAILKALQTRNSTLASIGESSEFLLGLGVRRLVQIQGCLEANLKGLDIGTRPDRDRLAGAAADGEAPEWHILEDEPPLFEPLAEPD